MGNDDSVCSCDYTASAADCSSLRNRNSLLDTSSIVFFCFWAFRIPASKRMISFDSAARARNAEEGNWSVA